MKIDEVYGLSEDWVQSSWIDDLTYDETNQVAYMTTISGYRYIYYNVDQDTFDEWVIAASKGHFFHTDIKWFYDYDRLA